MKEADALLTAVAMMRETAVVAVMDSFMVALKRAGGDEDDDDEVRKTTRNEK
jgi:hypothetical protein